MLQTATPDLRNTAIQFFTSLTAIGAHEYQLFDKILFQAICWVESN